MKSALDLSSIAATAQSHETHAINMAVLQYHRWYGY